MRSLFSSRRLPLVIAVLALLPAAGWAEAGSPPEVSPIPAVTRELSADGLFYTYMDLEGGWGKIGRELNEAFKASSLGGQGLDFAGAFEALGIAQIRALGMSSRAVGGAYDNRFFLYTPGGRAGLLSVFPGQPQPFLAAQFAPADADFVVDLRLDVPALVTTVETVVGKFAQQPGPAGDLLKVIREGKGNSLSELLTYNGRAIVIVRMHSPEQIEQAGAEFSRKLPADFFVRIESSGKLVAKELSGDTRWQQANKNGRTYFTRKPADDAAPEDVAVIVEGESVTVGSLPFAEECLAKKGALAADPAYQQALAEAATEGHLLVYLTPKFFASVRDAGKWLFLANPGFGHRSAQEMLMASQMISMLPQPQKPLTSVLVARDDGILIRGQSVESLKASLPAVALITPDFLGRIATYAARAWAIDDAAKHETERAHKAFAPQLQQVGEAALKYFASHAEEETVTLSALKAAMPEASLPDFGDVTSADLELHRASDVVTLEHHTLGTIEHVLPLTEAQRTAIEQNLRAIDQAALESMIAENSGYADVSSLIENGGVEPKPVSVLGEDYTSVSPSLTEPRLTVSTRGRQEVSFTREPKAIARARRVIAERQLQLERNLQQALVAAQKYFEASPDEYSVSFDDLAKKDLKPEFTAIAGENYSELSFSRDGTSVTLSPPKIGRVTYTVPPAAEAIAALRTRLEKLERAAADYFAKNPKAELVVGGEIYAEPSSATPVSSAAPVGDTPVVTEESVAPPPAPTPDLTAYVIRRDYTSIKAALESGYEVVVPRSTVTPPAKAKR